MKKARHKEHPNKVVPTKEELWLKVVDDELVFELETPFAAHAIELWLLDSLNKIYGSGDEHQAFKKTWLDMPQHRHSYEAFAIANCRFKLVIDDFDNKYKMTLSKMQWDQRDNTDYIAFITNVFKIVNTATEKYKEASVSVARFFFKSVKLKSTLKLIDKNIFDYLNISNPLNVEYPLMNMDNAEYSVSLESDFVTNLIMHVRYVKTLDKRLSEHIQSYVYATYNADVPDKEYPINEQLCLVEDVTKELLARASTLRTELEMKINKD